jgi:glycosyltransferase involved in cell wall biosynthesis
MNRVVCFFLLFFINLFSLEKAHFSNRPAINGDRKIVIVVTGYNNKDWYKKNLDSIFMQQYTNYHVFYVDDCSTDGTYDLVKDYVNKKGFKKKFTILRNDRREGCALANEYKVIWRCNDKDIIAILNADDFIAHPGVLSHINSVYADSRIWLTYGQFIEYPSKIRGFCKEYEKDIVERNAFREVADIPSHMRTFYAGLFKQIKKEDLKLNGEFLKMSCDMAIMLPMIEMARDHYAFIPEVLYVYNAMNPLSEHRVSRNLQRDLDVLIRSRPRYEKVTSPIRRT